MVIYKLNYTSNLTRFIDDIVVISIHKNTSEESTCGFHYTTQKYNGVTKHIPEDNLSLEKLLSSSPPLS